MRVHGSLMAASVKRKVAVIFGGRSAEHEVSLRSAASILSAFNRNSNELIPIGIDRSGVWHYEKALPETVDESHLERIVSSGEELLLQPGVAGKPFVTRHGTSVAVDAVFPINHGTFGEDGTMQGLLSILDVPFVGPDTFSSSLGMDKDFMKRILHMEGIPNAKGVILTHRDRPEQRLAEIVNRIGFPCFVKPCRQGSSVGVSRVEHEKDLSVAIDKAFLYDEKILVEEQVTGREVECSVRGNEEVFTSLPGEVILDNGFYSYDEKYSSKSRTRLEIPARLTEQESQAVRSMAEKTYRLLGCEGMARVDMFLKEDGSVYVNEINTLPGFTSISMYPAMWEASGLKYSELLDDLITLAMERYQRRWRYLHLTGN